MNTLGIAVAGLGSGVPAGIGAPLTVALGPAEIAAAVGVFAVATLGVLVVRYLNPVGQGRGPRISTIPPSSRHDDVKQAA